MDARAHGPELNLAASFLLKGTHAGDGGTELLGVFKFRVDDARPPRQRGFKLLGLTNDGNDFRLRQSRWDDFQRHLPSGGILRQQRPSGRLLPEFGESVGKFAADSVEFADRDDERAFEVGLHFAHFITGVAETA